MEKSLKTKVTLIEGKTIQYYFEQLNKDPSITPNEISRECYEFNWYQEALRWLVLS